MESKLDIRRGCFPASVVVPAESLKVPTGIHLLIVPKVTIFVHLGFTITLPRWSSRYRQCRACRMYAQSGLRNQCLKSGHPRARAHTINHDAHREHVFSPLRAQQAPAPDN
jgi:hypothetical protein